jgi:hypothetical protein
VRRPFRCLISALAAVAAAGALAACDTSPYAATVNGVTIPQTALNREIASSDASPAYVGLVEGIYQQATGANVTFAGVGTDTHSTQWAALALNNLVQAAIIHQAVVARGLQPGTAMLDAARGVLEAEMSPTGFAAVPAAYRDELVQRVAEHAELEQPGADAAQLQQVYQQYRADFYSRVCVRQISVSVAGTNGSVDLPASQSAATRIVSAYDSGGSAAVNRLAAGEITGGTVNCLSQADLEAQPASFITTVMALAPGRAAAPQRTSFGYNVVAVLSRTTEPFGGDVARALEAVILQREPFVDSAVVGLTERAEVRVNPAFGSWSDGHQGRSVPSVVPPAAPANAPGAPGTTVPVYDPFANT